MPTPDFEDLIKQINTTATPADVAAATIALRLLRAQASGPNGDISAAFALGQFRALVAKVKTEILSIP